MLDAIAAQGAVILPFSYNGATLVNSHRFTFELYTKCNSTPPPVAGLGCNDLNLTQPDGNKNLTIQDDVATLDQEITSVHAVWGKAQIIVIGHSQGGLIAFEWWTKHVNTATYVTHLFSLDSPINGVDAPVPNSYPDFSNAVYNSALYQALGDKFSDRFRFIGTWGDSPAIQLCVGPNCAGNLGTVNAYGGPYSDETLQHELLVKGEKCDNQGNVLGCPAPANHVSECSITSSSPDWVVTDGHFVVKFCPGDVAFVNGALKLVY